MNIVMCLNGHFYDDESFQQCPTCGAGSKGKIDTADKKKEKTSGIFGRLKKKDKKEEEKPAAISHSIDEEKLEEQEKPNENHYDEEVVSVTDYSLSVANKSEEGDETISQYSTQNIYENDSKKEIIDELINDVKEEQKEIKDYVSNTLTREISNISSSSEGKTMSYFDEVAARKSGEEVSRATENSDDTCVEREEPVVGWFVCIKGTNIGKDYRICSGMSSVGRSGTNRIVINDKTVSREKHAFIIYEPLKRKYYVKPGESSSLVYLNEEFISNITELNDGDKIMLGNCVLMFKPLCSDQFTWENYLT